MNERRTTSAPPRLLLELLAARLVLPRASDDPVALAARLARLESGLAAGGPAMTASPTRHRGAFSWSARGRTRRGSRGARGSG